MSLGPLASEALRSWLTRVGLRYALSAEDLAQCLSLNFPATLSTGNDLEKKWGWAPDAAGGATKILVELGLLTKIGPSVW